MSIKDIIMGGSQMPIVEPRTVIPVFALTESGKSKMGTLETGDIDYRIMDAISGKGTANMDEISSYTGLNKYVVRHNLIELMAQDYVFKRNMRG